jgi:hypothetical protein
MRANTGYANFNVVSLICKTAVHSMSKVRLCEKDKLAILGTASGSLGMAPYEDDGFEIWGVSTLLEFEAAKRLDVLFEMHSEGYWGRPDVTKRLKKWDGPLYMAEASKKFPNAVRYPIEDIVEHGRYHTTTITYMLALAYHSFKTTGKPFHVGLYGVHMEHDEEYGIQRPCCEYWIGKMQGAGMDVSVAPGGALLESSGLYGYENYNPICLDLKQRVQALKQTELKYREQENEAARNAEQHIGAQKEAQYILTMLQRGQSPRGV